MSRTAKLKLGYVGVFLVLSFIAGALVFGSQNPQRAAVFLALALLIPGRLQGWMWRDLFRGRRLHDEGRSEEALRHFNAFQEQLQRRPGLKRAIWLGWAVYTRDVEAMTQNNIGAAHLDQGRLDAATGHFATALRLDPQYAIPYFNLGVIAYVRGQRDDALRSAEKAATLGFTGSSSDRVIEESARLLARIEGRGVETHRRGDAVGI